MGLKIRFHQIENKEQKNPEAVEEESKIVFVLYRTKPLKLQVYTLRGRIDNSYVHPLSILSS